MGSSQGEIRPMKILIDANVLIDVALEREPFFRDSDRILALSEQKTLDGYISASSFSDFFAKTRGNL
jgi:predicted nucleic acid-binding protein